MRYLPLLAVPVAILALAPAAQGQAGKRPDPNSPAGVEYQLPLDQARQNAAGGGGSTRAKGSGDRPASAPLFGAGIAAARPAGSEDGSDGSGKASDRQAQGGQTESGTSGGARGDRQRSPGTAGSGDAPVSPAALGGGDSESATLRTLGIALAVLLVGALLGLALRRGLRTSS